MVVAVLLGVLGSFVSDMVFLECFDQLLQS